MKLGEPNGKYTAYTDTDKATALLLLAANDGNLSLTSRTTGIAIGVIAKWRDGKAINRDITQMVNENKTKLADRLDTIVDMALTAITKEKIEDAPLNHISTMTGTFIDKAMVLRGEATPDALALAPTDEQRMETLRKMLAQYHAGDTTNEEGKE